MLWEFDATDFNLQFALHKTITNAIWQGSREYFFKNFLWPQAWSLIPLPEVYTLYGEGGGIRT
jgi:hypothetical protein